MIERAIGLVLASAKSDEFKVTGLRNGERGRRVLARAGVEAQNIHLVRSAAELAALRDGLGDAIEGGAPLLMVRATGWVVAAELVEPLDDDHTDTRYSVEADGSYAGAVLASGARALELIAAVVEDYDAGDALVTGWSDARAVEVNRRARHPARTKAEVKQADAWQFELVNKPLDAWLVVNFYRPAARPFTRMFLRTPFTPNHISIFSAALSLTGCFIAAGSSWTAHVVGLLVLLAGGIIDACDGEVARLRLEQSKLGAWLDAIGDDMARLALVLAVGWHVSAIHTDLPIWWITLGALGFTLASMVLIYWYCIFVIGSSNNQDYGVLLGIGPGENDGKRSIGQWLGDLGASIARRDFIDLAILGCALVSLPEISFVCLVLGAGIGFAVVLPTHMKIVKLEREKRAAAAAAATAVELAPVEPVEPVRPQRAA